MREFEDMDAPVLQRALEMVRLHTGIHMDGGKQAMLQARLRPRLRGLQLSSYADYFKRLSEDSQERQPFIEAVTTHQTSFFRTERVWRHISEVFLPQWHAAYPGRKLRVWSAAASTGEEICTMAMCCWARIWYPTRSWCSRFFTENFWCAKAFAGCAVAWCFPAGCRGCR